MYRKISDEMEKLGENIGDFVTKIDTIDTWEHPMIWDMYLITPQEGTPVTETAATSNSPRYIQIDNNTEFDLFRPAKALIIDSLNISMLPGHDRDDVPFYSMGLPLGYEVDISFKSITKYLWSK
jgi:hypothetical protein